MKALLVVMTLKGGAGGSAYRLHRGLQRLDVDSRVLVKSRSDLDDDRVIVTPDPRSVRWLRKLSFLARQGPLERLPLKFYPNRDEAIFSTQWVPDSVVSAVRRYAPDVVNLRWVGNLLRIETIPKLRKPIVWTLSDMWPFTGGCYIPQECDRYKEACGRCPHLASRRDGDLSRGVWKRKAKAWRNIDMTIVTPSKRMAGCVRSSSLFGNRRVEVIPSSVEIDKYRPLDQKMAATLLGLPTDKKIVLFGAWQNHPHKGFHLLTDALQRLSRAGWGEKIELVVFGFERPANLPDLGVKSRFLGRLNDPFSKAAAYGAAHVFVAPSTIDNFANTVLEAGACGRPTVAFDIGGMPDIIDHEESGYVARAFDTEALARGIAWVLEDTGRQQALSRRAREKTEREYSLKTYAERYIELFRDVQPARHPA